MPLPHDSYLDFAYLEPNQPQADIVTNAALQTISAAQNALLSKVVTSSDLDFTATSALTLEYYNTHFLLITGALTGNRNVIVPATKKPLTVKHAGTGGYTITVKTPSGSGVSLAEGKTRQVFCDGTNVIPETDESGSSGQPYDQGFFVRGLPGDGAVLYEFGPSVRDWRLFAALAGSKGAIDVPSTNPAVITLKRDGSTIGTLTAGTGNSFFTVSFASDVDFLEASNHTFRVIAPSPQDLTLANFRYIFKATRL